jgi:ketosteroid isomerase-like protein
MGERVPDTDELTARLATLEARVAELEAVRAIEHTLVAYGFGVDSLDAAGTAALYTDDTRLVVDGRTIAEGPQSVHDMVLGPEHGAIAPGSAHVMGPFDVRVDGDDAVAVGYATTYARTGPGGTDGEVRVWRQAVNRWELRREPGDALDPEATGGTRGTWRIRRRESISLDDPAAAGLLRQGLPGSPSGSSSSGGPS